MEIVFYCADCNKFFYAEAEAEQFSAVCIHCGSEITINCNTSKEMYVSLSDERKELWKGNIRRIYTTKEAVLDAHYRIQSNRHREKTLGALFEIPGCRGRTLVVCKNKCIIKTGVTVGSVITGNATDGEKIIFFKHCAGLQFKEAGLLIGYVQFETPSMQMNNPSSNFFSENTFTFEEKDGVTNTLMRDVYYYVMELIENCICGRDADVPEYPPMLVAYLKRQ